METKKKKDIKKIINFINAINYRPIIKFIITACYLFGSILSTIFIFNYMLSIAGDSIQEVMLVLLESIGLSALFVFLLGLLSIFTHFVYIKLIYGDEIKNAAYIMLQKKRNKKQQING